MRQSATINGNRQATAMTNQTIAKCQPTLTYDTPTSTNENDNQQQNTGKDTHWVNLSGKVNTHALQERTCLSIHAKVKKDLRISKASADLKKSNGLLLHYI
jgi:hypothetical protein